MIAGRYSYNRYNKFDKRKQNIWLCPLRKTGKEFNK